VRDKIFSFETFINFIKFRNISKPFFKTFEIFSNIDYFYCKFIKTLWYVDVFALLSAIKLSKTVKGARRLATYGNIVESGRRQVATLA